MSKHLPAAVLALSLIAGLTNQNLPVQTLSQSQPSNFNSGSQQILARPKLFEMVRIEDQGNITGQLKISSSVTSYFSTGFKPMYTTPVDSQTFDLDVRQNRRATITIPPYDTGNGLVNAQSIEMITNPAHGSRSAANVSNSTYVYEPDVDYVGPDRIAFQVCYSATVCVDITFNLTVIGSNPNPNPDPDPTPTRTPQTLQATTNQDEPVVVDLSKSGKQVSSIEITANPTSGSVNARVQAQSIAYTPNAGFFGTDQFQALVCFGATECFDTTVNITVNEIVVTPPKPPVARDDNGVSVDFETATNIDVLANDEDPLDGLQPADLSQVSTPLQGQAAIINGRIVYTPRTGYSGDDQFTYTITNADGSSTATVRVNVQPAPIDPDQLKPQAQNDTFTITNLDPIEFNVLTNDTDPFDGIQNTDLARITNQAQKGDASIVDDKGVIAFEPDANFSGQDTFEYELCNTYGCTRATATIVYNQQTPDPQTSINLQNDQVTTQQNKAISINILENDSTVPANNFDLSTFAISSAIQNGTASFDQTTGVLTYTPKSNYSGIETFQYTLCDESGNCANATIRVEVKPIPIPTPNPTPTPSVTQNPTGGSTNSTSNTSGVTQQPRRGQVLGAYENKQTPRSGGQNSEHTTVAILLSTVFIGIILSLYQQKTNEKAWQKLVYYPGSYPTKRK